MTDFADGRWLLLLRKMDTRNRAYRRDTREEHQEREAVSARYLSCLEEDVTYGQIEERPDDIDGWRG